MPQIVGDSKLKAMYVVRPNEYNEFFRNSKHDLNVTTMEAWLYWISRRNRQSGRRVPGCIRKGLRTDIAVLPEAAPEHVTMNRQFL